MGKKGDSDEIFTRTDSSGSFTRGVRTRNLSRSHLPAGKIIGGEISGTPTFTNSRIRTSAVRAFGYGGGEFEGKVFGAEANAELVGVVGCDSEEGDAHGSWPPVGA